MYSEFKTDMLVILVFVAISMAGYSVGLIKSEKDLKLKQNCQINNNVE